MPCSLLRRFRRRTVVVDTATYLRLCAQAVLGEAYEIVRAEELSWLSLDITTSDHRGEQP